MRIGREKDNDQEVQLKRSLANSASVPTEINRVCVTFCFLKGNLRRRRVVGRISQSPVSILDDETKG